MKKLLVLLIFTPLLVLSQSPYQDFGTWTKLSSIFKINKKTSWCNKTELRTFDNSRQINQIYSQVSLDRKLSKKLSTSFAWRLKFINDDYSYTTSNRFHNDLSFRNKISDFKIDFRLRTQYQISNSKINELIERSRLKIQYRVSKKISIYLYDELYFLMNGDFINSYTKNRFGTGVKYKINKKTSLEFKYLKINDVNVEYPKSLNIIGFKISNKF
jgi:hypothetical protein